MSKSRFITLFFLILASGINLLCGQHSAIGVRNEYLDSIIEQAYELQYKEPQKAISNLHEVLNFIDLTETPEKYGDIHFLLGRIYITTGLYTQALEHMIEAEKIAKQSDNLHLSGKIYNNMGNILWYEKRFEEALAKYKLSLPIIQTVNDSALMGGIYMNMGLIKMEINQQDSALNYYYKAIEIWENVNYYRGIALAYHNIGSLYYEQKNYKTALEYHRKSLEFPEEKIPKFHLAQYYNHIGLVLIELGELNKARENIEKGLSIALETDAKYFQREGYLYLGRLDSIEGKFISALSNLNKYILVNEQIYNTENSEKISSLQMAFENIRTKDELEILKQTNELQNDRILNQKRNNTFLLIILILVLTLVIIYISKLKERKRASRVMHEAYNALQVSEEKLRHLVATKDRLFSIIAHDLKNPFNNIIGLSSLYLSKYATLTDEKRIEYVKQINISANKNFNLLENLLQWSRSQTGKITPNIEAIKLAGIVNENKELISQSLKQKNITLEINIPIELMVYADHYLLNTIFRNILSNSAKFTNPYGKIRIKAKTHHENVRISIADNGIGMKKEVLDKLFRLDEFVSNAGTFGEKGTGLGLLICKEFIDKMDGTISIISKPDIGTKFIITLPSAGQ